MRADVETARREPLAPPFFTGGTGRSGTTVVARLLDHHPDVARTQPWEARFLPDRSGLVDLVEARTSRHPRALVARRTYATVERFEQNLRGRWFRRIPGNGVPRGLHEGIDEATLEAALENFPERLRADPVAAAARLTHELLDPPARRRGRARWIETTPRNAARADGLLRIFPDARIVHMIRDGRDVAASVAARYWGPDDVDDALLWWEAAMLACGQGVRRAEQVAPGRVLTLQLEDLVLHRREESLEQLLAFLGVGPADALVRHFRAHMRSEDAHLARWEMAVTPDRRDEFADRYDQALQRLNACGVAVPGSGAVM